MHLDRGRHRSSRAWPPTQDIGAQLTSQLFAKPQALYITAGIIGVHGPDPGHAEPGVPAARRRSPGRRRVACSSASAKRRRPKRPPPAAQAAAPPAPETAEASWQDIVPVDPLGLEVGYRLIPLVDKRQGGELLRRIKGIRKKFAQEVGFLAPPVHIRDNLELQAHRPTASR